MEGRAAGIEREGIERMQVAREKGADARGGGKRLAAGEGVAEARAQVERREGQCAERVARSGEVHGAERSRDFIDAQHGFLLFYQSQIAAAA